MKTIYSERKGYMENSVEVELLSDKGLYHVLDVTTTINGHEQNKVTAYKYNLDNNLIRLAIQAFDDAIANHPILGKEKSE